MQAEIGSDTWVVNEMAEMIRRHNPSREKAKLYSFMWLTILAMLDHTTMSDVLDSFTRAAPKRADQRRIVARLRQEVGERA